MPAQWIRIAALLACACTLWGADVDNVFPEWYRPPQLFVMTGFIANTTSGTWGPDFTGSGLWSPEKQQQDLAKWNKGLGAAYDPKKTARAFKEAGATGVIFYDKWHDGIVPHRTKLTSFMTERDLVGETIAALRKQGLKIVIYYSVGFDHNPDPKFKDWVCLDASGKPMGRPFPADWMSFHSPYRQYVIGHLLEITKQYGPIDGLWLDIFGQPQPSYDRYSQEAFTKKYGKPLEKATPAELDAFSVETLREFLSDIKTSVRAAQPSMSFTFNGAGMAGVTAPMQAARVDALADFFSMEGHQWRNIDRGARTGHGMDRPFEVGILFSSSWYVPMTDKAPPPAMSPDETVVSAATAFIQGANVYGAMAPGHSGIYDENADMRGLRAAGAWLEENREWIAGAEPFAEIGIVGGQPSAELAALPAVADLWEPLPKHEAAQHRPGSEVDFALRAKGYLTEQVQSGFPARAADLARYRLVVLPENALLDTGLGASIRQYVREGGNLLAFGHASLLDEMARPRAKFLLDDVFGVEFLAPLAGYKQFAPGSDIAASLPLNTPSLGVRPTTAKVLATWASANDSPAIIENQFGKGRVIYVPGAETAFFRGGPMLDELTARLIGGPAVKLESSREYARVANRKGSDVILYLLNRSTGSRANTDVEAPLTSSFPGPEEVTLRISAAGLGDISSAELISPKGPVQFSREAGSVRLRLPASPSVTTIRLIRGKT
jgi:alpha-L-fucosidase